jgi:hypothetical protein
MVEPTGERDDGGVRAEQWEHLTGRRLGVISSNAEQEQVNRTHRGRIRGHTDGCNGKGGIRAAHLQPMRPQRRQSQSAGNEGNFLPAAEQMAAEIAA